MNDTAVLAICVALIAVPAGYAVERLYHEGAQATSSEQAGAVAAFDASIPGGEYGTYAISRALPKTQLGTGMHRPGRA